MRILLVDDEPEFLSGFGSLLQAHGHRPVLMSDARNVLKMIEVQEFDLICLDLMMPHIHGLQLIAAIHQRKPKLPILVISAVEDTEMAVHAAREGIEDYLLKPVDFNKLNSVLKRLGSES